MFKDGRTNVHDQERSGRPASASQFQNFSGELPQMSRIILYAIIKTRLGYHKSGQTGDENAHGWAQNARNGLRLDFLRPVPQN